MSGWVRIDPPSEMITSQLDGGAMDFQCWRRGALTVFRAREPVDYAKGHDLRWHISIAHPSRLPTWQEVGEAKDKLIPSDVFMCLPHPPRRYWINLHNYCLHLWEFRDQNLREQFIFEGSR